MSLLWITVFLLHQGYALNPVVTVQLGEPVTFTCAIMEKFQTRSWVNWYKQNLGDTMKLIAIQRKNVDPSYGPEFPTSRFRATNDEKISNLTILRTFQQDEGIYHCALIDWGESTWMGTYLIVKGNSVRTSNYIYVQQSSVSDPSRQETLQCSVLSEAQTQACSEDLSLFWFKAGSNKSLTNIIYTGGERADSCEKSPNGLEKCSYNFPEHISSSDPGAYYCAVAACGEILFGNGIRKEAAQTTSYEIQILLITIICLAISVTVNIIFICHRSQAFACNISKESSSEAKQNNLSQQRDEMNDGVQDLNYSTLHFSGGISMREKRREIDLTEIVYSQVNRSV